MNVYLLLALICCAVFCLSIAELLYIYYVGMDEFVERKRETDKEFGLPQLSYLILTYSIVVVGSLCGAVAFFLVYFGNIQNVTQHV